MRTNLTDIETFKRSLKYGDVFMLQAREMRTSKSHFLVIVGGNPNNPSLFRVAISSDLEKLKDLTPPASDDTFVSIKKDEYKNLSHDSYINCNLYSEISLVDLFREAKNLKAQRKAIDVKIVNRILGTMHKSKIISPLVLKKIPISVDKRGGQKIFPK